MRALSEAGQKPEASPLVVQFLGLADYESTWRDMQAFTASRTADTADEVWFLEHPPVYTQGRNGKPEHLHDTGNIAVIPVDRGGQVTYHGPGQLVVYTLLDLARRRLGVQSLVRLLEQTVIDLLADYGVPAHRRDKAPGVYVAERKIAALGLRVKRGCAFHGLSLNVDMDLEPFSRINPCGLSDLEVTHMAAQGIAISLEEAARRFRDHFEERLNDTIHE
ncbi:MAG: lipoyl(octanoyl) transferase LipB [Gammaproteobacteria bacterium]|nr:MAG: lipoyl(octanoyl) transferase LipB [Gammaproteobacteria bacterium]